MHPQPTLTVFQPPPTPFGGQPTVRDVVLWNQNNPGRQMDNPGAEAERRRVWELFCQVLGDRPVASLHPFDLLNFINSQPSWSSKWTRRRINATIQQPFNSARKLRLCANPFEGLTFPEGEDGRDWTDEEYRAVMGGSPALFRRLVIGILFSGLRPGEAINLVWPWIRLEGNQIVIENHKTRYKTKRPRKVPMNRVLGKLLVWCKLHNPPGTKHVFLNKYGKPWTTKAYTKRFAALRRRLGLPDNLKMHGGRHTFATRAHMNGVELAAVSAILGHKLLATTQRYVHVDDKTDHLLGAMQKAITAPRKPPTPAKPRQDPPMPLFDGVAE